jgi:hypothetical protein
MTIKGTGLLAIWSTVDADFETDYLHWLTREHVFERVGVPGFRSGRVFRRRGSTPSEYMILYEQDNVQVMSSDGYQARLNQPTPWTQRVMPNLQKFRRGGGTIVRQSGRACAFGACMAVARFEDGFPEVLLADESSDTWTRISDIDRVVNVYAMEVAADGTQIATKEKSMRRGGEGIFKGVFLLEALDGEALERSIDAAVANLAIPAAQFETYDLVFAYADRPAG